MPDVESVENDATAAVLSVEERFAIVPESLLDADVSDAAIRLYAVLLRYGQSSGARMPGRATLARRLRKKSVDTIDRAMRELVAIGAVVVEHRYDGPQRLTNRYHLRARRPNTPNDADDACSAGGRTDAATPVVAGQDGRADAAGGGRKNAAGLAAPVRHNPKRFTQSTTPTPNPPTSRSRPSSPRPDGLRVHLQAEARRQLRAERQPLTRATVLRRAHELLRQRQLLATATAT